MPGTWALQAGYAYQARSGAQESQRIGVLNPALQALGHDLAAGQHERSEIL
jgi:hypothetical protein